MVKQLIFILAVIVLSAGCKGPLSAPAATGSKSGVHNAVVSEVLHAGGYTYLKVTEKRKDTWLAVPGMEAAKGDKLTYSGGLEMIDFESKELKRTFPSVLFLESVNMESAQAANNPMGNRQSPGALKTEKIDVSIPPVEGCITIAKLLEGKLLYSDKTVKVRGKITKFNPAIMGKNWIHLQDGTEFEGGYDLTVTTDAQLNVGDIVTIEGKITLKKDFGYGYYYEVLMEDGKPLK
jgi:hypothetical protein